MRLILCTALLAALTATATGQNAPGPNQLTAKEIADGWVLLFDGQTTFGWTASGGDLSVQSTALVLDATKSNDVASAQCNAWFGQFELEFEVKSVGGNFPGVTTGKKAVVPIGLAGKQPDLSVGLETADWTAHRLRRSVVKKEWVAQFSVKRNGKWIPTHRGSSMGTHQAALGLVMQATPGSVSSIRNVKLRPLDTQPLFDGKTLAGWKVYKGDEKREKSRFTVTPEGWLNVKDGPGDLQTTQQWSDFVLQLDCISNGKHLNSGLFFRCLPGEYQQGYEAQIRNQWEDDDRSKPVDFGTGAIYRRQPARRVVSTDGEWFTMTVLAHGKHLATWVNGYPVVDWTDDRKEADNARNGAKVGKGAISIQGHDPTTDLSFRNIRIARIGKE